VKRLRAVVGFLALLALAGAPWATAAHAQPSDDWQVSRDPFDRRVVSKYKALLARNPHDDSALAKLLELYRRHRSIDLLVSEYEALLDKKPDDAAVLVVLGRLRRAHNDEPAALRHFEQAARLRSADAALWLDIALLYQNASRNPEATTALRTVLASGPSRALQMKALRALADLALAAGDIAEAKRHFEQYIALDRGNLQLRLELGDALLAANQHGDAISVFRESEKLLATDPPRRVEVIARLAAALEGSGDDDAAVHEYQRAMNLVPRGYYIEVELTARIIDIHRRRQRLPELALRYEKEWPAASRRHFEWNTLARLYEETGNQDRAVSAYQHAVAASPLELDTQRRLIALLESVGHTDAAMEQLEKVTRLAPGEARFQIELAERYFRRGTLARALEVLGRLEHRFPGDVSILSAAADLYTRWGKPELAIRVYERLTRLEPDDASHLSALGEYYFQKNEPARAVAIWKRIAEDKGAKGLTRLGDILAEHNLLDEALAQFKRAIALEPNDPEPYRSRARALEQKKAWNLAIADWESVLRLMPSAERARRREAQRQIVTLITRTGAREHEYRRQWLRDFSQASASPEAGYFLVEYFLRRPQAGEPRKTLERLHSLVPQDQDVIIDLVKALRSDRQYDEAVKLLLALATLAPSREREVYSQIAEIKTESRNDTEALQWAQKALAKTPNDAVAHAQLAERYVEMQRFDEAIAAYEKTVRLDLRNYPAHFALATLQIHRAQPERAVELYRAILRTATDEEIVARAGKEAIDLEELTGTLGELEKVLSPLSFVLAHKPIYRRLLIDLYLRYIPQLAQRQRSGAPEVADAASAELIRIRGHGLKPLLEALADDRDPQQQKVAVTVLGHLGNRAAAMPLVQLARQTSRPADSRPGLAPAQPAVSRETKIQALIAAGRLASPEIVGALLPLVREEDNELREAAVFALGRSASPAALAPLLQALGDRKDGVQALACLGLAASPDPRALDAATRVVADARRHDAVRAICAFAMAQHPRRASAAALIAATRDNSGETQRLAAWALGRLADPTAISAVLAAYLSRGGERSEMRWALARMTGGVDRSAPGVAPGLSEEYPLLAGRFDFVSKAKSLPGALAEVTMSEALFTQHAAVVADALRRALGEHRDVAARALEALDDAPDHLGLIGLLGDAHPGGSAPSVRQISLGIAPALLELIAAGDDKLRALALSVLSKVDPPRAIAPTEAGLGSDSSIVRRAALTAAVRLSRGPAPQLTAAVVALLAHPDWQVRRVATTTVGEMAGPAAVAALQRTAGDSSSYVREATAAALGQCRSQETTATLATLAADPVAQVRAAVARALETTPGAPAQALRRRLREDPVAEVRAAAGK
jgi:tetratricopeptide (TPR) repeat protein